MVQISISLRILWEKLKLKEMERRREIISKWNLEIIRIAFVWRFLREMTSRTEASNQWVNYSHHHHQHHWQHHFLCLTASGSWCLMSQLCNNIKENLICNSCKSQVITCYKELLYLILAKSMLWCITRRLDWLTD